MAGNRQPTQWGQLVTQWMASAVEHWDIGRLIPYARNARTHSEEQIAQIAASIVEFGFTNPILVGSDGVIVAGHGRLAAARKLGLETVPVVVLDHLTPTQRRALIIADNRIAENAGWNEELLRIELEELAASEFDLKLTGFSEDEIEALLADSSDGVDGGSEGDLAEDETPEVQQSAICKPGDVWILGSHRLMCGDSTSIADVERLMAGQKAQLLHADPPYGMGKEKDGVENDNLYGDKLDKFQMEWFATALTVLTDNASCYIWGNAPDLWRLWYRKDGIASSGVFTFRNEIVWDKGSAFGISSADMRSYAPATERCLFFIRGAQGFNINSDNYWEGWEPIRTRLKAECDKMGWGPKEIQQICGVGMYGHWFTKSQWHFIPEHHYRKLQEAAKQNGGFSQDYDAFRTEYNELKREFDKLKQKFYESRAYFDNTHDNMTDVWRFDRVQGAERYGHATPKPVAMMERIMRSSLPEGGLCFEPFGGTGSTLIAAEKTGRRCYTMEIKPEYCDVIVRRWQHLTGKSATLESSGQTFAELEQSQR